MIAQRYNVSREAVRLWRVRRGIPSNQERLRAVALKQLRARARPHLSINDLMQATGLDCGIVRSLVKKHGLPHKVRISKYLLALTAAGPQTCSALAAELCAETAFPLEGTHAHLLKLKRRGLVKCDGRGQPWVPTAAGREAVAAFHAAAAGPRLIP